MTETRTGPEQEHSFVYSQFSPEEKESLRKALVEEIREVKKDRRELPAVRQFILELTGIVQGVRELSVPQDRETARVFTQHIQEIQNALVHISDFFLLDNEQDVKEFFKQKIQEALKRSRETHIFFLEKELSAASNEAVRTRLTQEKERIIADLRKESASSRKITPPIQKVTDAKPNPLNSPREGSGSEGGVARLKMPTEHPTPDSESPPPAKEPDPIRVSSGSNIPPTLSMPSRPAQKYPSAQPTPAPRTHSQENKPALPTPSKWKMAVFGGIAAVAGLFGVKIVFEQTKATAEKTAEIASHALESYTGSKMSAFPPARFEQQPSEPPDTIHKQEAAPLTRTYTIIPNDTLWGLAGDIVEEVGVEDADGTLTLQTVKKLREANNIQGDPARSQKMWVGKTLDLTSAYDFVASQKTPEAQQPPDEDLSQDTIDSPDSSLDTPHAFSTSRDTLPPPPDSQHFSAEILSPTLNYPGETVWSRTHDMLESLGMKPNMAKRGVLGAIVLADSNKTEAQAARIKYTGHKKFDPARDTLNFTRAAQAALDLQNGMSPGEVAKKYGVKNQYERFRDR